MSKKLFKRWPNWIGYIAIIWSVLYGGMHLYWLLGRKGYPFQTERTDDHLFGAMISYLSATTGGILFAILCLLGVCFGFIMQKYRKLPFPRWILIGYSWGFAFSLILFVPDISLIAAMAYAFLFKFALNWQMVNQVICLIGALLWMLSTVAYQRKTRNACEYCGIKENKGTFLLERMGKLFTILAALAPIPYAITRFAWALNIPLGIDSQFLADFSTLNPAARVTEWVFGFLCVGGSILTLGLIQKWGEIFPRWFPVIGGKRVPITLAVIPASIVALAVTAAGFVFTFQFLSLTLHFTTTESIIFEQLWGSVGPMVFWVPWGVFLGLSTIAYYYRRRGICSHCGRGEKPITSISSIKRRNEYVQV
ncbi:hypothetical protein ACFFF5_12205 [Lederbergia wuyishanensis]|uniref:Uncharacterized protein n=1 Tax=Lederbergia wuyishanensis TaxID=1347903 RepID=A0ABU0D3V8_9BACI|nr:hypothetical protein [Lederbergia wuyishanensis]MCJ8007755.1 hypothetical protein [Lederbergia wuyishanensis]MDQ0343082.1 hypothetical protein [Lederbergia wuyishanensis]